MNFLDADALASMRADAEGALDGTAVIQVKESVSDGAGGRTTKWNAAGTVACRLAPYTHGSGEAVEADRLSPDSEYLFTFPAGTDLRAANQLVYDGGTFTVTNVRLRSQEVTRRVEAKRIS